METPAWMFDELAHAGAEHLDDAYVASFDEKSPTDWSTIVETLRRLGIGDESAVVDIGAGTGAFAAAIRPHVRRVVADDVSPAVVATMRARGLTAVPAGFLSYEPDDGTFDAAVSPNALHHLPDFFKALALQRLARILRAGGVFVLDDLVFSFDPGCAADAITAWLDAAPTDPSRGWTAEELAEHVRTEHSTFTWLLEPMLDHAGFDVRERRVSESRTYARYVCLRRDDA